MLQQPSALHPLTTHHSWLPRSFQEAAELLMGVVREVPNLQDPYHTLGLIHEALHEPRKALDFYMIAAHLAPKVRQLCWRCPGAFKGCCHACMAA